MLAIIRRLAPALTRTAVAGAAALTFTIPVQPAMAQQTYPPEVENQCRDDYFRFCSSYALGSDELRRCMESKGKVLSRNCQQALKDAGFVKTSKSR